MITHDVILIVCLFTGIWLKEQPLASREHVVVWIQVDSGEDLHHLIAVLKEANFRYGGFPSLFTSYRCKLWLLKFLITMRVYISLEISGLLPPAATLHSKAVHPMPAFSSTVKDFSAVCWGLSSLTKSHVWTNVKSTVKRIQCSLLWSFFSTRLEMWGQLVSC